MSNRPSQRTILLYRNLSINSGQKLKTPSTRPRVLKLGGKSSKRNSARSIRYVLCNCCEPLPPRSAHRSRSHPVYGIYQRFDPQFLLMRLRHATIAQDDLSEARANAFVQGSSSEPDAASVSGKDIDDFVKEFRELRKTYHKRMMWGDRWTAGEVTWRDD